MQIERKTSALTLKENPRRRFQRLTEVIGRRRTPLIVPATGLEEFSNLVAEMAKAAAETPEKSALSAARSCVSGLGPAGPGSSARGASPPCGP